MNKIFFIVLLLFLLLPLNSSAQASSGVNCPEEPLNAETFLPDTNAPDADWDRFATWQGLTAGFHMNESSFGACVKHCAEHAAETEAACRNLNSYRGFGKCEKLYQTVYLECTKACRDLPH